MNLLNQCKALADETRLRMAGVLGVYELSVGELVELLGMGQSGVSRHLKILVDAGLLECRRDGLFSYYTVASNGSGKTMLNLIAPLMETALDAKDREKAGSIVRERGKKSATWFNTVASRWSDERAQLLGDFDLDAAVIKLLPLKGIIADIGCGNGALSIKLAQKGLSVIGIDRSEKMIQSARKSAAAAKVDVDFRIGESDHLPVRNNEINCAILALTLHHIAHPAKAFLELSRSLADDGVFIIADFEKHSNEDLREKHHDLWLGFSRSEIHKFCESIGFNIDLYKKVKVGSGLSIALIRAQKKRGLK